MFCLHAGWLSRGAGSCTERQCSGPGNPSFYPHQPQNRCQKSQSVSGLQFSVPHIDGLNDIDGQSSTQPIMVPITYLSLTGYAIGSCLLVMILYSGYVTYTASTRYPGPIRPTLISVSVSIASPNPYSWWTIIACAVIFWRIQVHLLHARVAARRVR